MFESRILPVKKLGGAVIVNDEEGFNNLNPNHKNLGILGLTAEQLTP